MSAELILGRTAIAPLQGMLRKQRWVSSTQWERQQSSNAVRGIRLPNGLTRGFRILIAARGTQEDECLVRLAALLCNSLLWELIDGSDRTVRVRRLAFTRISTTAAYTGRNFGSAPPQAASPVVLALGRCGFDMARMLFATVLARALGRGLLRAEPCGLA